MAGGTAAALIGKSSSAEALPGPKTVVYKVADKCEIKADVYPAADGTRNPAVMWAHGGALIQGSRKWIDRPFLGELRKRGFAVVSIDYRLAPETKLVAIIEDLQDAWKWLRKQGPEQFGIDPQRIAVAGGSAGGYLALMAGFCLDPRPRALVSYYGYGDIGTPWYAKPDDFYRRQTLVSKEDALRSVGERAISEDPAGSQRGRFYLYCRQNGIWPSEVTGHDPAAEPKWFDGYCPIRNVTDKYPPVMLIHGAEDTDVPYQESSNMAARLTEAGIKHEFVTVKGAGHMLSGAKPEEVARIAADAADFVKSQTG